MSAADSGSDASTTGSEAGTDATGGTDGDLGDGGPDATQGQDAAAGSMTADASDAAAAGSMTADASDAAAAGSMTADASDAASESGASDGSTESGTCDGAVCALTCATNYVRVGAACTPPPSRPIGPLTGNMVSTATPTLTWILPTGFTGAQVDVCADRACTNVLWTSPTVTGTSAAPSNVTVGLTLPAAFTFWRVFTMDGGQRGTLASATWEFQAAGTHSAPRMTSWPNFADIEGDGYADLVMQTVDNTVYELAGSSTGVVTNPVQSKYSGAYALCGVTDVNGDGLSDVVVWNGSAVLLFPGSSTGYPSSPTSATTIAGGATPTAAGDVNGDGYGDVVELVLGTSWSLVVLPGAPTGFGSPLAAVTGADPTTTPDGSIVPVGDVNNDGYADIVVRNQGYNSSAGRDYLYLGGPNGLVSPPATTFDPPAGARQFGGYGGAFRGQGGTDVNGDGYIDLFFLASMVSNAAQTVLYVYYGAATGFDVVDPPSATIPLGTSSAYIYPAGGGDVNGDGYGDLLADTGAGILVFHGGAAGISTTPSDTLLGTNAVPVTTTWNQDHHLAVLGDVNGDGLSDFASGIVDNGNQYSTVLYLGTTGAIPQTPAMNLALYPATYTLPLSMY